MRQFFRDLLDEHYELISILFVMLAFGCLMLGMQAITWAMRQLSQ